jgi:hypothetical protein
MIKNYLTALTAICLPAISALALDLTDVSNDMAFPAAKSIINSNNVKLEVAQASNSTSIVALQLLKSGTITCGEATTATGTYATVYTALPTVVYMADTILLTNTVTYATNQFTVALGRTNVIIKWLAYPATNP